ncbi:L-type lectin-domain containing receptor kinase IX.1-like, partial [Pyrus communis]|uniref:L-type lectin-domain containing receptor kinase IX.1-like n=1 Tax=Pyrus communis TaxID=23211 RepID=UPI0035C1A30F
NLTVSFTSFRNNTNDTQVDVISYLSYTVDLKQYLPDWVIVGFSAATGNEVAAHKVVSWNFTSTALVDLDETDNTPLIPAPSPGVQPKSGNANSGLLIGLGIVGSLILVGGLGLVWFIFCKKRKAVEERDENPFLNNLIDEEIEKGAGPRKFSYRELAQATSNFEEGKKLGEGGFGVVYKGFIKDLHSYVAVKKISSGSKQGLKEYASEVRIISRLRHRNLVQLIGWCHEESKLLLVYEFMSNGSLDSHLFKETRLLSWPARYKIVQGLASGLFYLHEQWEQCVLHRDIKSSNVMLDSNFNVKLGDFGLARLVDHGKQSQTTVVAGTRGYMALEYITTGRASKESDVYSFGVVALEIACGRKAIDLSLESSQIEIVEGVWELYGEGKFIQAGDPKLNGHFDEEQMERLMIVGLWCAHPDFHFRPSVQQAIQVLNSEVALPNLPSKMPVATYFAPATSLSIFSTDTISSERGQTNSQDIVKAL